MQPVDLSHTDCPAWCLLWVYFVLVPTTTLACLIAYPARLLLQFISDFQRPQPGQWFGFINKSTDFYIVFRNMRGSCTGFWEFKGFFEVILPLFKVDWHPLLFKGICGGDHAPVLQTHPFLYGPDCLWSPTLNCLNDRSTFSSLLCNYMWHWQYSQPGKSKFWPLP